MIRHAAAVAIALCLSPAWLYAQTTVLTVNTVSAAVYLGPSTGSLVIGQAPKGTALPVTRELGSWVKVSWPGAQDGAGYVHVSMGQLRHDAPSQTVSQTVGLTGLTSAPPALPEPTSPMPTALAAERSVRGQPALIRPVYVTPSTHLIGLGGLVGGSNVGFGATARAWSHDRFGMQLEVSRSAQTSAQTEAPGRVTSTQFEPSLLFALPDQVTDYVWMRPYLGSGLNFRRQTLNNATPGTGPEKASESKVGLHLFGGGELTFASMPRFALSVDVGYQWARTSFAGVDLGGPGISASGHWYVK
jgi:hypothetical protein